MVLTVIGLILNMVVNHFPVPISQDTFALFCEGGYNASYPSGHAARSMIFAIIFGYALSERFPRGAYLMLMYPVIVSLSRTLCITTLSYGCNWWGCDRNDACWSHGTREPNFTKYLINQKPNSVRNTVTYQNYCIVLIIMMICPIFYVSILFFLSESMPSLQL